MDLRRSHTAGMILPLYLIFYLITDSVSKESCDSPLVSALPQSAFTSSSELSNSHGPGFAKLNRRDARLAGRLDLGSPGSTRLAGSALSLPVLPMRRGSCTEQMSLSPGAPRRPTVQWFYHDLRGTEYPHLEFGCPDYERDSPGDWIWVRRAPPVWLALHFHFPCCRCAAAPVPSRCRSRPAHLGAPPFSGFIMIYEEQNRPETHQYAVRNASHDSVCHEKRLELKTRAPVFLPLGEYPGLESNNRARTPLPGQGEYPTLESNNRARTPLPGQGEYPTLESNNRARTPLPGQGEYPTLESNNRARTPLPGQGEYPTLESNNRARTPLPGQGEYPGLERNNRAWTPLPGQGEYPRLESNNRARTPLPGHGEYPGLESNNRAFSGNSNADSVVMYKLQQPVIAQYVRILPLHWNPNGRIGLRLEAYGCQYKSNVVGFDGSAHLLFRPDPSASPADRDVLSMNFKTLLNSGMLVHVEERSGHTLTLELFRGKLQLQLRKEMCVALAVVFAEPMMAAHSSCLDEIYCAISFGGASAAGLQKSHSRRNLHGCLENVLYKDISVIERAEELQVSIRGNVSFTCTESIDVPVTFSSPGSFLALPWVSGGESASVALQFRTWNRAGLLMTFDLQHNAGTLWLYLSEARARLQIHKTGRIVTDITAGATLNDGQWHSLELAVRRGRLAVTLDRTDSSTASTSFPVAPDSQLFLGGCPDTEDSSCRNPFNVFRGCMRLIRMGGALVDLIRVQQMLFGNFSDLQMDMCGIVDRCSPSRCEHGGRCSQSWSTFHCNCSATGYSGATCHSSIYEASCEAYKHKGNTSGFYYIDVDGSGPVKPQLIYCNMSDKAWMVIQHNNTELTKLKVSSGINQHLAHFNYSADVEQIQAIITQAEYCVQELSYHCKKSRLLNTPAGNDEQFSVIREVLHDRRCRSFIQESCRWSGGSLKMRWFFNRCEHGLRLINWMRTSAKYQSEHPSNVFVFPAPTRVLFSFDVGNGPLEVKVETPAALNDERWHHVRAERNVKEASLYVDHHPGAVQKAPADGHIHLQLNSQLFVGGTASRQKGFLGCIRSLKLNGKTLDLEERAEITPGVTPGCPGHCSSYGGLCQNHGSCVEDHSGFTCDCSLSPFTGTFCHKESGEVDPEIARLNALGFTGCLSVVQFNSISPLKAALLYPDTSPVIVTGPLSESSCGSSLPTNPYAAETTHSLTDHVGSVNTGEPIVNAINSDSALIGDVIAVVIFVSLAALAVMARFLYRRKETFQPQEPKVGKTDDSPETPFNTDPNSQSIVSDYQKEYFI
ncbi:contactin-associated protein-like 4 [Sinocyclocheilus grahami]|uniref:contactin-associated protein-like 4 n=1 Tax=Sinocyclocheilus grahami TaxID=75366 RepID=UPI0007AC7EB3|nr:PREDICTED: contactin-associated protein-like 4 [Sinocyclocheilus grahami]